MDVLSSSWGVLKEKPKALFRKASKRDKREQEMETPVTPFPYTLQPKPFAIASRVSLTPTSQWSPVSATFTDAEKPHVLVKRSKSSVTREGGRQARSNLRPLVAAEEEGERRSRILSVVIFPLTRRKSKSQVRTSSPTSSDSDNSSISSRFSRPSTPSSAPAAPPALRRSASVGASHRVRPKYDQLGLPPPPPVPKMPSPTSDTWAKLPKRSQSQAKRERPRPIVANVEGYWDHLDLLDYQNQDCQKIPKRGRDPAFPTTPQTPMPQKAPVPF